MKRTKHSKAILTRMEDGWEANSNLIKRYSVFIGRQNKLQTCDESWDMKCTHIYAHVKTVKANKRIINKVKIWLK